MKPRRTSRGAWIALLLVVGAIGALFLVPYVRAEQRRHGVHEETIRELLAAKTSEDREAAAGRYGVVLTTASGGWIVIAYRDSHGWPGYSDAVAMTSDGRWFHSTEHFCGALGGYSSQRRLREASAEAVRGEVPRAEEMAPGSVGAVLEKIERATDMARVSELMGELGFGEMERPG